MNKYRNQLPQLANRLLRTDAGLETTPVFKEGIVLPHFAAFDLLKDSAGTSVLRRYFQLYAELAVTRGVGLVLETPSWRANPDWAAKLGYDAAKLASANPPNSPPRRRRHTALPDGYAGTPLYSSKRALYSSAYVTHSDG